MFKPLRSNPYFRFQRTCNPNPSPQIIPMVRKRNIYRWRERKRERIRNFFWIVLGKQTEKDRPVIGNGVAKSAKSINGSLVIGDDCVSGF